MSQPGPHVTQHGPHRTEPGPLRCTAGEMRRTGYRTIDAVVDAIEAGDGEAVVCKASAADMRELLDGPPPEQGVPYEQVLERVMADVLPYRTRCESAGYMGFIPGYPTWPGALADLIASALMVDSCWWAGGAGPSQLELTVLRWFAEWIGFPPDASGVLVSGGSAANMTAMACAREAKVGPMRDDLVLYVSSQCHSSIARAARALGFRPERVRVMPVDRDFRMRADVVERAIAADRAAGLVPLAVCASAGATNTGSVDPLAALADVCAAHDVWLHVDGAYGAFAALTERGRRVLTGIERADSVTLDPHKWLFQPFECGAILVRDPDGLRRAFEIAPDYLRDVTVKQEVNFSDRGLQLTRFCRSLKVWMSIQTLGLAAFRQAVDTALDLAQEATARVRESEELELMAPVPLSVVALRRRPPGETDERRLERINLGLVAVVEKAGALVSSTRLFGRTAIRLVVLNPTTTAADVHRVLDIIERTPIAELDLADARRRQREPDVMEGWLTNPSVGAADLGRIPLFAAMRADDVEALLEQAAQIHVHPGQPLIEQWGAGRDFYVIVDGVFSVHDGETELATLRGGDFVGELAALDWGAGYGAVRMAGVVAQTPAAVLVFTPELFGAALRRSPAALQLVEATARARMAATAG